MYIVTKHYGNTIPIGSKIIVKNYFFSKQDIRDRVLLNVLYVYKLHKGCVRIINKVNVSVTCMLLIQKKNYRCLNQKMTYMPIWRKIFSKNLLDFSPQYVIEQLLLRTLFASHFLFPPFLACCEPMCNMIRKCSLYVKFIADHCLIVYVHHSFVPLLSIYKINYYVEHSLT